MYIPIGPSKKQLYKIIIALLLLCYLIFLGMYKPKAEVYTFPIRTDTAQIGDSFSYTTLITNSVEDYHGPVNQDGYVLFTMNSIVGSNGSTPGDRPLNEVLLQYRSSSTTISETYICEFGTTSSWTDNNKITQSYSIKCPIPKGAHFNSIALGYNRTSYTHLTVDFSDIGSFVSSSDNNELNQIITILQQMQSQGSQQILNNINNTTTNINNNLNDSSIDNSSANNFTSNSAFQDSNGLDAIIKAPLNFIQSLTSSTCSSISLTIPYIDANVSLPCMSTIYTKALGQQLVNLIALVINGVVLYRYCLKILQLVHNAKNPNKDELEVLDL